MKKAIDLRQHLANWLPDLANNPEKLHVIIDKGSIATRRGKGLGFEYRYTVQVIITDFAEPTDAIIVPLLAWIETNQPDLIDAPDKRDSAISFEAEMVDHDKVDIAITIALSERVLVESTESGGYTCTHLGEPAMPDLGGPLGWSIYLKGELIAEGNV